MESKKNKKLKSFGKNRREIKQKTTYDADGHWVNPQREEDLRARVNPLFDRYYNQLQGLGAVTLRTPGNTSSSAGEAWETEMNLFRQPLPITFWINDTDPMSARAREYLQSLDASLVSPIPWYPVKGMGWRIWADRTSFRKREDMLAVRQFLIQQTALGTISRQEEVSMIPPFLLDIQPTDICLDMCASPGSKTAQMLLALARHKRQLSTSPPPSSTCGSGFPYDYLTEGLVVANELDTKRANMLVHQVKRLRLLFPFALFTNHDARYFPDLFLGCNAPGEALRFDKILCDVVCSGDGTLRKAPHVFKIWTPREAMNLQKIQIQIALRAAHLLKIGGRLVYSTCSLNPVENEAVVAQIVHRTGGAMKLVDARHLLPDLKCAPGMTSWTVTDAKGNVVAQPEGNMHEALFPPNTPGGYASEAADSIDLSLCMRFFPTHCAGGGFFVAVLDKVEEFRFQKRSAEERSGAKEDQEGRDTVAPCGDAQGALVPEDGSTADGAEPPHKRPRLAPPQFFRVPDDVSERIYSFFQLKHFPMHNLMVRAATGDRQLRVSQGSVANLVSTTAARILLHKSDALLVVSCGLRVFATESLTNEWRIASEAACLFPHYLKDSPRTLHVPLQFVQDLIKTEGNQKKMHFDDMREHYADLMDAVLPISLGPLFLVVHGVDNAEDECFYTVGLRARSCLQLLVDHEDIEGVRLQLGMGPSDSTSGKVEPVAEDTTL